MLPAPIEHRFRIEGDDYCLVEWDRGGDRRIKADYAMSLIAVVPLPQALQAPLSQPTLADPQAYSERITAMNRHLSTLIEVLDGDNLWVEAIARECLRDAPEVFWEPGPVAASANGVSTKRVTLEKIPRALWQRFSREVQVFREAIFRQEQAEHAAADAAGDPEPRAVATAEALPPMFRGRAE